MEIENMVLLPSVNWKSMKGKNDVQKRLNGWLSSRFVDSIASPGECEDEAKVIIQQHRLQDKGKFKDWLKRYLWRVFQANELPRPRETDLRQILEISSAS